MTTQPVSRWFRLVVLAALTVGACQDGAQSGVDGKTSWLGHCRESADCHAGLACRCRVCTASCTKTADCSEFGTTATCADPSATTLECGASERPGRLCVDECTVTNGCADACPGGVCGSGGAGGSSGGAGTSSGGAGTSSGGAGTSSGGARLTKDAGPDAAGGSSGGARFDAAIDGAPGDGGGKREAGAGGEAGAAPDSGDAGTVTLTVVVGNCGTPGAIIWLWGHPETNPPLPPQFECASSSTCRYQLKVGEEFEVTCNQPGHTFDTYAFSISPDPGTVASPVCRADLMPEGPFIHCDAFAQVPETVHVDWLLNPCWPNTC